MSHRNYHSNPSYPISASPAGNHPSYRGQEPRTPSVYTSWSGDYRPSTPHPGSYFHTPTASNRLHNPNGDASFASSLPSTVASNGETMITVVLGEPVQNGILQTNVYESGLQQYQEAFMNKSLDSSPSFETSERLDRYFIERFQHEYLNDFGQAKICDCRGLNEQGEHRKRQMRVHLSDHVDFYVQQLQEFENDCTAFITKNDKILSQFANFPDLAIREIAKNRRKEVEDLACKVRRMKIALDKYRTWLDLSMDGKCPEHQDTLFAVQEILHSFTFPGSVTVCSTLKQVMKGDLDEFSKSLNAVAATANLEDFEALGQVIQDTFKNIRDDDLEDDTQRDYYWLLYNELRNSTINSTVLVNLTEKMLKKAKEQGLIHHKVSMYHLDTKTRINAYQWCKYFLLVVFGSYQELESALAEESVYGEKRVLAHRSEAERGNWTVSVDAQREGHAEDMDEDEDEDL